MICVKKQQNHGFSLSHRSKTPVFDDFCPFLSCFRALSWGIRRAGLKTPQKGSKIVRRTPFYKLLEVLVLVPPLGLWVSWPNPGEFWLFGQKTGFWARNQYYPSVARLFCLQEPKIGGLEGKKALFHCFGGQKWPHEANLAWDRFWVSKTIEITPDSEIRHPSGCAWRRRPLIPPWVSKKVTSPPENSGFRAFLPPLFSIWGMVHSRLPIKIRPNSPVYKETGWFERMEYLQPAPDIQAVLLYCFCLSFVGICAHCILLLG